ncbi:MAG: hypothetical protein V2A73_11815 [Pseudomonadota bacterium]
MTTVAQNFVESLRAAHRAAEESVRWYESQLAKAKEWRDEAKEWLAKAEAEEARS